jgi:phosphatidylglycerol:prolipoprotein diacylglycerol transferase
MPPLRLSSPTVHSVLFKVPLLGLDVYSYGVLLGLSLLVGWFLTHYWAKKEGLPRETIADTFVIAAVVGLAGARLLYVAINAEEFRNPLRILQLNEGGLTAWGGLLGGALAAWIYLRRRKLCSLAWFDAATPSVMLGLSFTGLGSFLHGSDFGRQTDTLSWAVQFPAGTPAYEWHDQAYGLAAQGIEWSRPVHPVQLYAVAAGLALFGLVLLARRYRTFSGQLFLLGATAYSSVTYVLEIFRGDPKRGWLWLWSSTQVIAVAVLIAAVAAYGVLWRRYRRDPSKAFDRGCGLQAAIDSDRKAGEG